MSSMQLFNSLQGDSQHHISLMELKTAMLSWLKQGQPGAAHAAWQRHGKLTANMGSAVQQEVFEAALAQVTAPQAAAAIALAKDACMAAAVARMRQCSKQLPELMQTMSRKQAYKEAHTVRQQLCWCPRCQCHLQQVATACCQWLSQVCCKVLAALYKPGT